jgi:hypothetical protein
MCFAFVFLPFRELLKNWRFSTALILNSTSNTPHDQSRNVTSLAPAMRHGATQKKTGVERWAQPLGDSNVNQEKPPTTQAGSEFLIDFVTTTLYNSL